MYKSVSGHMYIEIGKKVFSGINSGIVVVAEEARSISPLNWWLRFVNFSRRAKK